MGSAAAYDPHRVVVIGSPVGSQVLCHGLRAQGHEAIAVDRHGDPEGAVEGSAPVVLLVAGPVDADLRQRLSRMLDRHPDLRLLVLQGDPDWGVVPQDLDCETVPLQIGIRRLAEVIAGQRPVPDVPTEPRREQGPSAEEGLVQRLTDREREVLCTLMAGLTRDDIADKLSISPHTVRTHLQSVFTKLGAHNQLEAVSIGLRSGLQPAEFAVSGAEEDVA